MFTSNGNNIQMTEGDFGVELPIVIGGLTFTASDSLRITIKSGGNTLITKEYTNISQGTIRFVLTEEETSLLPVGVYVYSLDWYQEGVFMNNIIPSSLFKVGDKA